MTDDLAWGPVRDASGTIIAAARGDYRAKMAAVDDMLAAIGPLAMAARTQAAMLRHTARDATSGVARVLIEAAERWEKLEDNAHSAITKALDQQEQPAHVDH